MMAYFVNDEDSVVLFWPKSKKYLIPVTMVVQAASS